MIKDPQHYGTITVHQMMIKDPQHDTNGLHDAAGRVHTSLMVDERQTSQIPRSIVGRRRTEIQTRGKIRNRCSANKVTFCGMRPCFSLAPEKTPATLCEEQSAEEEEEEEEAAAWSSGSRTPGGCSGCCGRAAAAAAGRMKRNQPLHLPNTVNSYRPPTASR
ncbi:hypothetical protein F2P81_008369 [Scophthalmus maximus]|uniref:Uncharacterized protein n=1 Tax=Scophthalmus maximus TaxID=52904 RepID=A0A6A4TAF9_SCOMX|nr:hypothetical protein F2P81_008369 [Scophthalmus maximus]